MSEPPWPSEWLRGVLSLCVLSIVAEEETYGYVIAQRLQAAGLGVIKGGTLYPALARLEQDGLLTSAWRDGNAGPGRKYFAATPAGQAALAERTTSWLAFTGRAAGLLTAGLPTEPTEVLR